MDAPWTPPTEAAHSWILHSSGLCHGLETGSLCFETHDDDIFFLEYVNDLRIIIIKKKNLTIQTTRLSVLGGLTAVTAPS